MVTVVCVVKRDGSGPRWGLHGRGPRVLLLCIRFSHASVSLFAFSLQFSASSDFLHSPKLRPSQGVPVIDELFFSRKRASRNLFQNSIDLNSEHSSVCAGKY